MTLALALAGGGSAEVVETDGTNVAVRANVSSPPGSILSGIPATGSRAFRIKVRSCRRLSDQPPSFRIEGRFVDLTREQRALLPGSPDSKG